MSDWTQFKKSFTQEQEDALWQYFIDHSRLQKNGYLGIMFYITDIDDFWRRVYARYTGDFQRYDKLEKREKQLNVACSIMLADARKKSEVVNRIMKNGTIKERALLWLYQKTRDSLFKKIWKPAAAPFVPSVAGE